MLDQTETQTIPRSSLWNRLVGVARAEGPRGLVRRVIDRSRNLLMLKYGYVMACRLSPDMAVPSPKTDLQVQVVSLDDPSAVPELASMYQFPATIDDLLSPLQRQELCYVARVGGRIAGYVWARPTGKVYENGYTLLDLAADEVYLRDAYTLPEYRGKNIYPVLRGTAQRQMAANYGKTTMMSFIMHDNHASLNASRKMGEVRTGVVILLKLFGRKRPILLHRRPPWK